MPKTIDIPDIEVFDENKQEFIYVKGQKIQIEHSLVSISKWESKWKKPFFSKDGKTIEETIDYIRCMTLTQNVNPDLYNFLPNKIIDDISKYIEDPMTATWFSEKENKISREIITSEKIYYWMITLNIPIEFQKWHINRLMTLIRVCNEMNNASENKMSKKELMNRNRKLNAERRARAHSKG